ncbi:MAG: TnsD family Tn7-like transposition protein [Methylococcales bacterium]|nr:transposase [Methylococcaceae bacterium]
MLGYFPVPYGDELLYSIVGRHALHTGLGSNQKAVIREVFSSSTAAAIPDLPSHLDALVHNLQLVWPINVEDLIASFTLASIYLPFLSQDQAAKVIRSMRSDIGGSIHTRSGIAASTIKQSAFFRYCPECIKEQVSECGEAYWRRSHQLPGLAFCKGHSCILENSPIYFRTREKHHFVATASSRVDSTAKYLELSDLDLSLHDSYIELLQSRHLSGLGAHRWTLFYRNLANDLGLMHKSRVQHKEIYQLVKHKWDGSTFECHFQEPVEKHWLVNLFRKHRKSFHPLMHLLVLSALIPKYAVSKLLDDVSQLPATVPKSVTSMQNVKATESEIEVHRQGWRDLLKQNPDVGIKGLRGLPSGGALYVWLYRNDKQWLMCNKPQFQPVIRARYETDYQHWDESNVAILISAHIALASQPNRPRLTQTQFIKALPRANSVEKHLGDLPDTRRWLTSHAESVEDHQLYRLCEAFEKIKANNTEVKRWRLLRIANIRQELITPKIETEILKLELRRD